MTLHKQRKKVRDRLVRAEGHLRGIIKMVDEGKECPEILVQIAAVKAALEKAGAIILEDHLEHCLIEAVESGDIIPRLDEFKAALQKII
ncbi:metal-sensitive transcriptional regulator [Candidatus Bathyarchaeota archaeon]|nr:metal-sensitive transcriptional regulator [Candidatus Bathyarchaeota archaeon]